MKMSVFLILVMKTQFAKILLAVFNAPVQTVIVEMDLLA